MIQERKKALSMEGRNEVQQAQARGPSGDGPLQLQVDAPLFAHADGSSWTVGEVRASVKRSAQKLGLDPSDFAERSLNVGGKAEMSGAGKVIMQG